MKILNISEMNRMKKILKKLFKKQHIDKPKARKIRVGIDINEILRARWAQFDKYYYDEFGENGIPKEPYVYDFFKNYEWKDKEEITNELKEPENMPDKISPVHYQVDEKTGEAPVDSFLFKGKDKKIIPAKEVYNRFMYEDFAFEIHGTANLMHKNLDLDAKNLFLKYKDDVEFVVISNENFFSIPSTLFFLSKMTSRFTNYCFVDKTLEMWNKVDILITTDPEILTNKIPNSKFLIKVKRPYNEKLNKHFLEIVKLKDLIDNKVFEKIIKFKINEK